MIYWSEMQDGLRVPHSREFDSGALTAALAFAEAQRARQHAGEPVGFVTLCSENPDSVGRSGVADAPADYQWKKRRP